jgi:hypothetical protein
MAIGISKSFPMDLDIIARLLQLYGERPGETPETIGKSIGLNRPKVDGLNALMGYLGLQERRVLTLFGKIIFENDKYLKDQGTLFALHCMLSTNSDAEVWYFAVNEYIPNNERFSRDEFALALDNANIGVGNTRLKADRNLFLNAYTSSDHRAFQSLGYLTSSRNQNELFQSHSNQDVPGLILGYALYQQRLGGIQTRTVSINNLLTLDGQIGKVFLLKRELLLRKLRELESLGFLGLSQIADLDNITFANIDDPLFLLADYYKNRK